VTAPSFTSITPSSGHTSGRYLVKIIGNDFQLPEDPPATGYVGGTWEPSMEIEINGRQVADIMVWSTTELTCTVPEFRGDPSTIESGINVDIVLRNLGPPEEEITITDGFQYQRNSMARTNGTLANLIRELLMTMRRQVINNIASNTGLDYDSDVVTGLGVVELAELPGIAIFGPQLIEDTKYKSRTVSKKSESDTDILEFTKHIAPKVYNVIFSGEITVGYGDQFSILNLMQEIVIFFKNNKYIVIPEDTENPMGDLVRYDLILNSPPNRRRNENTDDIMMAEFQFSIASVPIGDDEIVVSNWGTMTDDPPDITIDTYKESF